MNCEEIRRLIGPYLDSELELRDTLEVRHHLAACPDCARQLADDEAFASSLTAVLKQGGRSPELWRAATQIIQGAAAVAATHQPDTAAWWSFWRWPVPRFYTAVAAVWVLLIFVQLSSREPATSPSATPASPPAETRMALAEQRALLTELLDRPSSAPSLPKPPAPRSQAADPVRTHEC